jgi:hypothetical protein
MVVNNEPGEVEEGSMASFVTLFWHAWTIAKENIS